MLSSQQTPAFSHLFEVDFSETYLMSSADTSVSEPSNLKIYWGGIPPDLPLRGDFIPV